MARPNRNGEAPWGLASRETHLKLRELRRLRAEIQTVRARYRVAPRKALEQELQKLVARESDLSSDVGFGDAPGTLPRRRS
jgi:hypothetical protein